MESSDLFARLVCPDDHSPLAPGDERLLHKLNEAVARRTLRNRAGRAVAHKLGGALVRGDRTIAYAVIDGIPRLLVDEGIPLDQVGES